MKQQQIQTEARPLTLAEICEAIANGQLPARIEDGYYTVSHRELRQLRREPLGRRVLKARQPAGLAS